jgi:dipeptidyl aminopeptidase/acylaminoacyl peptidase
MNLGSNETKSIVKAKGEFSKLTLSETGEKLAFIADLDTTKALIRPYELHFYEEGANGAVKIVDQASAPSDYLVSTNGNMSFSKDETRLYFGLATPPVLQDTSLLSDEIVDVEVWTYDEPVLYTMQEESLNREKRRTYLTAINLDNNNKLVQLGSKEFPSASITNEGNANFSLVRTTTPYEINNLWDDVTNSDYALVNIETGDMKNLFKKSPSRLSMSPSGKYLIGYNPLDTTWFTYNIATEKLTNLTKGKVFYDEINDRPSHPSPYGIAGWTENDASVLIYDRFDIWEYQPESANGKRLTDGRNNKTVYRYVRLDDEEQFIKRNTKWLLTTFNEGNKNAGYYEFNGKNNKGKVLVDGPYRYSRPRKAQQASKVIFTRQSFIEFPDIRYADMSFKSEVKISDANPQQSEYNWGTAEIVKWTSLDGLELEGLLIKPENFDPNKKYPMIVNYYEKSSNGLHTHRAPYPGRSTISYSFYASRGYIIFNPDIYYRVGYPGESAYNCLVPGVTTLLETGYIDKDNIGLQGHSWGGYQNAYLITKTDLFKAAEIGAPVPNMISAYGGIRWGTGRSRISQYEHGQSRIGGTPWEYPIRFIENSPIFFVDKINTPSLIMHNDADTAVPWYQGIEFFMALRRLGKPAWLLNYNGEPHWPVKLRNRKDFNIRMAQFFDYYLQGAPMPVWMDKGVPAIEKGINQGYELKK